MCGITGIIQRQPDTAATLVEAMCNALQHRGPDSQGFHRTECVQLGMRRLRIIDLAGGEQPMTNERGTLAVVFNGEIYNFRTLRRTLESAGHRFATASDTEVLTHGYEEWGIEGLLEHLDGMFAFALHDRETGDVFLARDRAGEKPLFYYADREHVAFSSELQSLVRCPFVPREIDPVSLHAYLALHAVPAPRTMLRHVQKMLPGHYLRIDERSLALEEHAYWTLTHGTTRDSFAAATEHVRELLSQSVERALFADVPVGIFLSGGLDSSVLTALAASRGPALFTFSVGFAESEFDESSFARNVAQHFGTQHTHVALHEADALRTLPAVVASIDEPCGDQAFLPVFLLAQEASRSVKVVLSGEGADELFGGYDYYPHPGNRLLSRWKKSREGSFLLDSHGTTASGFPLLTSEADRRRLLLPEIRTGSASDAMTRMDEQLRQCNEPLQRAQAADFLSWLPDDLLMKLDTMTMAASIEGRAPYLSRALIEYCFAVPSQFHARSGEKKSLLRAVAADLLPAHIAKRPKQGFRLPMSQWLRQSLRPMLLESIMLAQADGIDTAAYRAIAERHLAGNEDRGRLLYSIMVYRLWFARLSTLPQLQTTQRAVRAA